MSDFNNIKSKTIKRGDPNESVWPSDFGTGARKFKRRMKAMAESQGHYVINDTMDEIKSPINPKLRFDSKRAYYKHISDNGYEIVGNEYERGYDPGKEREKETAQRVDTKIKQNLIDRMIHGKR